MLFRGTKDALGFWHLQAVSDFTYMADKGKIDFMNNITNKFYTVTEIPNDSARIFVYYKMFKYITLH